MSTDESPTGTSETLTDEGLASVFEGFLSDMDSEDPETPETPPTQEQAPESEPESAESSTEQDAEQGESEEIEQTEETEAEESTATTLDPNLLVRVKVNGEEQEIPLAEALRGYSRTQDYTRKTQELADQRKQVEEINGALRVDRERYAVQLTELERALTDAQPQEPDWVKLQQEDPESFPAEWARWSQYKQRMQELAAERQRATEAVMQDRAEAEKAYLREQQSKLVELIPEWKDAGKAKADKAKMVELAEQHYGYTQDELRQVKDARIMNVLRDAMQWRELQKKKPSLSTVIHKVKTATPGSGAPRKTKTKASEAKARLAKSGSLDDLAAVFEATELADM